MSLGERMRIARLEKGVSQTELAKKVGISQPAITALEKRKSPTSGYAHQIAECLNVNVKWLVTGAGPMDRDESSPVQVKVIDWQNVFEFEKAETIKWIPWYNRKNTMSEIRGFALEISGVSMEPEFFDGDTIIVDPDQTAKHNDYVIIDTGEERPLLRQLIKEGGDLFLRALNPAWNPQLERISSEATIRGVVVQKNRNY